MNICPIPIQLWHMELYLNTKYSDKITNQIIFCYYSSFTMNFFLCNSVTIWPDIWSVTSTSLVFSIYYLWQTPCQQPGNVYIYSNKKYKIMHIWYTFVNVLVHVLGTEKMVIFVITSRYCILLHTIDRNHYPSLEFLELFI